MSPYGEDSSHVRTRHAAQDMASLRSFSIAAYRADGWEDIAAALRWAGRSYSTRSGAENQAREDRNGKGTASRSHRPPMNLASGLRHVFGTASRCWPVLTGASRTTQARVRHARHHPISGRIRR
jgi:hypothetical protein